MPAKLSNCWLGVPRELKQWLVRTTWKGGPPDETRLKDAKNQRRHEGTLALGIVESGLGRRGSLTAGQELLTALYH